MRTEEGRTWRRAWRGEGQERRDGGRAGGRSPRWEGQDREQGRHRVGEEGATFGGWMPGHKAEARAEGTVEGMANTGWGSIIGKAVHAFIK